MYVFLSFSLGLIYTMTLQSRFRAVVGEPHMCFIAHLLSPLDNCLFARIGKRILRLQRRSCGFLGLPLLPLN